MEDETFLEYIINQRRDFVKIAVKYSVKNNLRLRTEIDSLLIAYDQMVEIIRKNQTTQHGKSKRLSSRRKSL